jgi:PAS domain S-box-containing protein
MVLGIPEAIRGGISVAVPLEPYLAMAQVRIGHIAGTHASLWILGVLGIFLGARQMRQRLDERLRAEAALRESEFFFKESQRVAHIGSYRLDFSAGTWISSAVLDQIFGIGPEFARTLAGWLDLIYPEDRTLMRQYFQDEVLAKGQAFDREYRIVRQSDGAVRWMHGLGTRTLDPARKPLAMIGTIQDITERKQAEQTQTRLVDILNATPDFVGFADARTTGLLQINPAGRQMTGIGAEEDVTRLKITDIHPEWTNKLLRDESIPAAIRDGVWTGECAFLNRDGREMPVAMVLLAHKSLTGEVERFSTISRDITERKQAEAALRETGKSDTEMLAWVNAHSKRLPLEIVQWSSWMESRCPGGAEAHGRFQAGISKLAPKRTDITTFFERLDLDDYVSFGGRG